MPRIIDEATAGKGLVSTFQPIADLAGGQIVGYEALARWPDFGKFSPVEVLLHAEQTDQLSVLDQACIRSALSGALQGSSTPGMLLLVNSEPRAALVDLGSDRDFAQAAELFRLSFEFTERGLLVNPGALLRKVEALRSLGCCIALDDVGANPDSLAVLDVVRPDIVKLDMGLVQREPDRKTTRIIAAIAAHQERTGAVICAEGIENDDHLERAMEFGATLGQGRFLGEPGKLAAIADVAPWSESTTHRPSALSRPGKLEAPARTVRRQVVDDFVDYIQDSALAAESTPIVLAALGSGRRHDQSVVDTFSRLAETSPLVAMFGRNPPRGLSSRVRWVDLGNGDRLNDTAFIVALGPDTAAGMTAHRQTDSSQSHGAGDHFTMRLTFDRNEITITATELLSRLV